MTTRRALSRVGLSGAAAIMAAASGATWYYANRLTEPPVDVRPARERPEDRVTVLSVGDDTAVVEGPDSARPGHWGLAAAGGYGQLGPVVDVSGDPVETGGPVQVTRGFTSLAGQIRAGDGALLDPYAYPADPTCLGLPFASVAFTSPVGELPAWVFPGSRRTWVILAHGRSARRHEAFRALPAIAAAGLPAMAIAYRNDPDAPRSADGRCHLGATEWEDVEAAVAYALDRGADDVILFGYSMGGACAANVARLSPLAARVRALVLEAPVLDWGPVIRRAAVARGLPPALLPLLLPATMALARARTHIDWDALDALDDPAAFATPTLLIHGSDDPTVPVEVTDAFAAARPDVVTYLRIEGAGHVRSWNTDRDAYERAVADFLTEVVR